MNQVKSKKRVTDHGEVFTSEREVNAMLDLVKQETERIDSRFLEPACGTGNFLAEVLKRKLSIVEASIISHFREVIYEIPVIVAFNWPEWEQGKEIVSDKNFDFDSIDIPTKCKIISAIARNDRFCDGVLLSAFQSGMMLKILKSIKGQIA